MCDSGSSARFLAVDEPITSNVDASGIEPMISERARHTERWEKEGIVDRQLWLDAGKTGCSGIDGARGVRRCWQPRLSFQRDPG
jgi:hypothetical protein